MWWILVIILITILYQVIQRTFNYWERKGFPYEKPNIPFGNLVPVVKRQRSVGLVLHDIYKKSKGQIIGIYLFFKPALLVCDAQLVKQILTSDFSSFHDRGVYCDEKNDPLSANLFTLPGQSWKTLRMKLTPSFSSGKLKGMFGTINDVGDKMINHLNNQLDDKKSEIVEVKALLTKYAIDIIGSVIFGLDVDSFSEPNNEFRLLSHKLFEESSPLERVRGICSFICPPIVTILNKLGIRDPVSLRLRDLISRTIELREQKHVVRKDLLQLLVQLRNTGKISEDDDALWDIETSAEHLKSMSIDNIAAQSFLFYIAGSETTSATASFTLYELARYPALLQRAETEVMKTLEKHNLKPRDAYTFEAMKDMKFLDLCIMETIRKYPGLPLLNREATKDFPVPGTNYVISKGTSIVISLFGLHRDPELFPDPLSYNPDRFDSENPNYNTNAYLPFGDGPRRCIAERMGRMNAKLAVAKLLANFEFETVDNKEVEFKFHSAPVLIPANGLNVRISKKH